MDNQAARLLLDVYNGLHEEWTKVSLLLDDKDNLSPKVLESLERVELEIASAMAEVNYEYSEIKGNNK